MVVRREPKLNEDVAELSLLGSPALLAERLFELRRRDHAGLHQAEPDPGLITGLLANHAQKTDQVERPERLDDEGGGPHCAREGAVLRIVARCEQHHTDGPRFARGGKLPTHREAIAVVSLEVHVQEHHLRSMLSGHGETLPWARRFEHSPTLSRQRHPGDRAQSRVIVRYEDGRRVGTSSSAVGGKTYGVGPGDATIGPLLALPIPGSSETLVALFRTAKAVPLKIRSFSGVEKSIPSIEVTAFSIEPSRCG